MFDFLNKVISYFTVEEDVERRFEVVPTHLDYFSSLVSALLVALVISFSANQWTLEVISDGSVYDNSRWGRLPAAYETITEFEGESAIFIGSSRFYSGIDGSCMDENSENVLSHWNLAVRGDIPYLRLPETELLSDSGASVVVLEAGPNSFSSGIGTPEHRVRWQIFGLTHQADEDEGWYDLIHDVDRGFLITNEYERLEFTRDSLGGGAEEFAYRIMNGFSSSFTAYDGRLPEPGSDSWISSLKNPPMDEAGEISQEEFDAYLESLIGGDFWMPRSNSHDNRIALEYIASELDSAGIEVILFSPPVHPDFLSAIPRGHWDEFNKSKDQMSQEYRFVDWTWEVWEEKMFVDPHHFSESGRLKICSELGAVIGEYLES